MGEAPRDMGRELSQRRAPASDHSLAPSRSLRSPSLALGLDSSPVGSNVSHCAPERSSISMPLVQDAGDHITDSSIAFDASAAHEPGGNRALLYIGEFSEFTGH